MTTIYLIRHGEILTHSPRRFIGRCDLPLTERGREQACRLGEYLTSCSIDRIVCSPLGRCRESAEIIGSYVGCRPEVIGNLIEIDLGAWDGLTVQEVKERYPGSYESRGKNIEGFRPHQGESFQDLLERVLPVFTRLAGAETGRVAIISHAGVNRVLLCHLLGMPLANLFRLEQGYGCINIAHAKKECYRMEGINIDVQQLTRTSHEHCVDLT